MANKFITEDELEDLFNDMLDDIYGMVEIAGFKYDTSRAWKEVDPVAWKLSLNDYADSLIENGDEVEGYTF